MIHVIFRIKFYDIIYTSIKYLIKHCLQVNIRLEGCSNLYNRCDSLYKLCIMVIKLWSTDLRKFIIHYTINIIYTNNIGNTIWNVNVLRLI